jgi:hypothetical protein
LLGLPGFLLFGVAAALGLFNGRFTWSAGWADASADLRNGHMLGPKPGAETTQSGEVQAAVG